MGETVNLNKRRKQAERLRALHLAAENRRKFGRSKAEKAKDADETRRAAHGVDRHRLDK
jgi:hypothetical protein